MAQVFPNERGTEGELAVSPVLVGFSLLLLQ